MRKLIKHIQWLSFSLVLITSTFFTVLDDINSDNLFIIGNSSTVKSSLSKEELKEILYAKRQKWNDGNPIKIALMHDIHPTYLLIAKDLYELSPGEPSMDGCHSSNSSSPTKEIL